MTLHRYQAESGESENLTRSAKEGDEPAVRLRRKHSYITLTSTAKLLCIALDIDAEQLDVIVVPGTDSTCKVLAGLISTRSCI